MREGDTTETRETVKDEGKRPSSENTRPSVPRNPALLRSEDRHSSNEPSNDSRAKHDAPVACCADRKGREARAGARDGTPPLSARDGRDVCRSGLVSLWQSPTNRQ